MQPDWIYRTTIYEVNLRQFTKEGTFAAFRPHLPRLKDMGVETLWFMPITPIARVEMKGSLGSPYACSDYTAVNPEFGTLDEFRDLVKDAQSIGFKVIIDWVANHTGWDHVWTKEHPDWYEQDPETGTFKRASGMDDIIELDYSNPDLRSAMTEAMKFWVRECNIDGFRCDLASWVEVDYWLEAIPEVNRLKRLFWLAEADALDVPEYMQVFDAAYTWTWMHRSADWYRHHQPLSVLNEVLLRYDSAPGIPAWFTSNHDENTWNGTEYEKYGDAALVLAVHTITWKGLPLVYNGQEQPNRKRLEFFEKDPIDWSGEPQLHGFYHKLLRLHLDHPALDARADLFRLPTSAEASILAYLRKSGDAEIVVLLNLSANHVRFDLKGHFPQGRFVDLFTNEERDLEKDRHFTFAPWQYSVLTQ